MFAIFRKYLSITDYFSKYHLDFFYRGSDNERWLDRVNSDEPKYGEMNVLFFLLLLNLYENVKYLMSTILKLFLQDLL